MGGVQAKALGFEAGANLNEPMTRADFIRMEEHKRNAKFGGVLPAWIGGAVAAIIYVMIVPILAFVIIIWQRGN